MKNKFLLLSLILSVFFLTNACQDMGKSKGSTEFKIDYEKYVLENGLDVILHQDKSDPIVSVAILFHVGSNREKPGKTGFAHFFEHMLFQNSENVGKGNFFKKIEELGGTLNGGTWQDGTIYYEVVPKDALEKVLWMESDRMGYMINTVTVPVLENEKQVVKNEKRQRVDNQPYGHTDYVIGKALYPEGHPYNWQVIGSLEDLEAATIDDVKEFYHKYYGPNNATLVLAGDFEFADAKELVDKYFGEIPVKEEIPKLEKQPATLTSNISLMHEDNFANLPELTLVYPAVEDGHPDSYALDYLAALLSDGKRAPLYKEIVENQKLAPRTRANNRGMEVSGTFTIKVRSNEGVDLDEVHNAIFAAYKNFEESGIDDKDMERIKNSQEISFYNGISSVLSKSFQLAQFNEFRGEPAMLEEEIKKILAVTKDDVMRVYEKYIKGKNYIATSFVPKGQTELALNGATVAEVVEEEIIAGAENAPIPESETEFEKTISKIDRSIEPTLGESPVVGVPQIWTGNLSNGLSIYGIENSELPLVEFSLRIKGGMLLDDPTKIGVANLITDMMMEGTKNKTPEELEDAIGQLGSNIGMYTNAEFIEIYGNTLARNFTATFDLLKEILLEPRWDSKEFDRVKAKTLTDIQQRSVNPNVVAASVFNKLIYGSDHILSNSSLGTMSSVEKITIDDLKQYYDRYFAPNISSLHLVGSVSEQEVMVELDKLATEWQSKEVMIPAFDSPREPQKPSISFVDIPGAKQSVIQVGKKGLKGNDDDFFMTQVINYKLGGSFNSQLNMTLREEKGYTYGARSGFTRRINDGSFIASSSVRSNVTKESVEIFKSIIENYVEVFSQEDLDKTRKTMIRSNARAFETLNQKMGILENISTFDLPVDYIARDQDKLKQIDLNGAKALIRKYMDTNQLSYLIVGDAATQLAGLEQIGLGIPKLLDREGVPVEVVLN